MASPAGPCEWCGGQQRWTVIRGLVHVSCVLGCLPLPLECLVPPPDSDVRDSEPGFRPIGTFLRKEGTEPCEGGEASEASAEPIDDLPW